MAVVRVQERTIELLHIDAQSHRMPRNSVRFLVTLTHRCSNSGQADTRTPLRIPQITRNSAADVLFPGA
jgi:hypothetical protein